MDPQREKAMLSRILEEGVYTDVHFKQHKDERMLYLEEEVLPTLVPALKDLLSEVAENRERLKKSDLNPIDWFVLFFFVLFCCFLLSKDCRRGGGEYLIKKTHRLAQYLMRYNVRHNTHLHSHPYTILLNKHTRQVRADIEAEKSKTT